MCEKSKLREDGVYVQLGYPGMKGEYFSSGNCWYAMARVVFEPDGHALYTFGSFASPMYFTRDSAPMCTLLNRVEEPGMIYNNQWKPRKLNEPCISIFDYFEVDEHAPLLDVVHAVQHLSHDKLDLKSDPFGLQLLTTPVILRRSTNDNWLGFYNSVYVNNGGWIETDKEDPHIIHIFGEVSNMDDDSHNCPYVFIPNDKDEDTWDWKTLVEKWELYRKQSIDRLASSI